MSRSKESSLPYSEEQREMSSNLLEDSLPTLLQEPVAVIVNPVQTPLTVQAVAEPVQTQTVQTPVTVQASLIHLDTPSHAQRTYLRRKNENVHESGL